MQFRIISLVSLLTLTLASPVPAPIPDLTLTRRQTPLNIFVTELLNHLPAINGPITAVVGILTSFQNILAFVTQAQTTYNELSSGTCKEFSLIFARGTTEPGNVGILVGPAFIDALKDRVGRKRIAFQGVNGYKADVPGYLAGGEAAGSTNLANQISALRIKCPNTKLIVGGYSQGGQLIHNAADKLAAETAAWISKVVIFGDPFSKKAVTNVASENVRVFCNSADAICHNGALILPAHLTYLINAPAAAVFATS